VTALDPARNENFRFLVDATPDLVLVLDDEAIIRYAGSEAAEVLVESSKALAGRSFFDLIHPDDRGTLPQDARGLATHKANGTTHWEVRLKPAEESTPESELDRESARWINLAGRDRREDGLGIVLFVRDVTEKRRAADEAWLLRRAVDAANNLIVIADARAEDRPLVFANSHFSEVTGYDREEVIGRNCRFLQVRPDGTRDGDQDGRWTLRGAVETGEKASTLIRNYRKDGTLFWNELYLSPLRNADGTITHFVGVQNDVTEREEARRSLEDRERLLRSFYDSAPVMMGVAELIDQDGDEQVCYRYVVPRLASARESRRWS
jgi:PAS domain S-box-containing protein